MIINAKTRYGLRTRIEIALQKTNHGILQKDIAKNHEISGKYPDHITAAQKVAGLIKNVASKKSGYMLVKPASEITPVISIKILTRKWFWSTVLKKVKITVGKMGVRRMVFGRN